jgi:hypothetical protein
MIVRLLTVSSAILSMADCTSCSDFESSAEVASSNTKILGFFINARAIAILYFWPPDKFSTLPDPTYVSSPFSSENTKLALASYSASFMSCSDASLLPYFKFSRIVPRISTGSYDTYPIVSLRVFRLIAVKGVSSKEILPDLGS